MGLVVLRFTNGVADVNIISNSALNSREFEFPPKPSKLITGLSTGLLNEISKLDIRCLPEVDLEFWYKAAVSIFILTALFSFKLVPVPTVVDPALVKLLAAIPAAIAPCVLKIRGDPPANPD